MDLLAAARSIGPLVADHSDRIEAKRRLSPEVVAALTEAGIFQMYLPRAAGGSEAEPLTALAVAEELARNDGSVGWCVQVSAAVSVFLAWIDPDALDEMVATTPAPLHVAGSARPLGTAVRTDDGFRASGHWNYASGVRHANWFLGTCFLDGASGGRRVGRSMLFPIDHGEIIPNWDVVGMRGTGSDDFVLDDVLVPRGRAGARHWVEQRNEPLYDPRFMMVALWSPTAGVALGLAQAAIDALVALGDASSTSSPTPLRERPTVQDAVADAEAITGAARSFCVSTIGEAWEAVVAGGDVAEPIARAQLAITHSMTEAVKVADLCFRAAGTNAISTANRLERILRDTHTGAQHAAGQPIHRRLAAQRLLGLDPPPYSAI